MREKIIKAMKQAFLRSLWASDRDRAEAALTAIAEQGYAVVPREADDEMILAGGPQARRDVWSNMVAAADIARKDAPDAS